MSDNKEEDDDRKLRKIEANPAEIIQDKTSSNGTNYNAIVLPNGEWVFVWEGGWKDELDKNIEIYQNIELELYVIDKEEDPGDHFYNLQAVVPSDPVMAEKIFEHNAGDYQEDLDQEQKTQLLEKVEKIYS